MLLKRICSWCNRTIGYKECQCAAYQTIEEPISHSICPECFEKAMAEIDSAPAKTIKPNR